MPNRQPSLRFDHREIAVIFSLFVFVSLLMFTVGILVGKGLSQARYEGNLGWDRKLSGHPATPSESAAPSPMDTGAGNSVTTPTGEPSARLEPKEENAPTMAKAGEANPLKLIPQKVRDAEFGSTLLEPKNGGGAQALLKNPKIAPLLEDDPTAVKRNPSNKIPDSAKAGKFTVQVGSYPTEKDAVDRVDTLKKLGFPYATFSANQLGETKGTWFRVWLGYYPDYDTANEAGRILRDRGEVKQYLVRKADTSG